MLYSQLSKLVKCFTILALNTIVRGIDLESLARGQYVYFELFRSF